MTGTVVAESGIVPFHHYGQSTQLSRVILRHAAEGPCMNGPVEGGSGGELTLVFALAAMEAFENPSEVFADAREWSQHIGVVANDTTAVKSYLAAHNLHQDFDLGERDKWMTMADIRETATGDRYVFVGASPEDQRVAAHTGWEFIPYTEAAEKAGWTLADQTDATTGLIERLRDYLSLGSL